MDCFLKFWNSINWQAASTIITLLFVIATFIVIFVTVYWNKRSEQRRTIPFLGLSRRKGDIDITPLDPKRPGWPKFFNLDAKNIGLGPIIHQSITAKQGPLEYKCRVVTGVPEGCLSYTLGPNQEQTLRFEHKQGEIPNSATDNHIEIKVLLRDLYANAIEIVYLLFLLTQRGKLTNRITDIEVVSVSINGKRTIIPELVRKYEEGLNQLKGGV